MSKTIDEMFKGFRDEQYWVLDGKLARPVEFTDWAIWFENADRRIRQTRYGNGIFISTVFLGLNHSFGLQNEPLLFETMVFNITDEDGYHDRYSTWAEAMSGHERAIEWVRKKFGEQSLLEDYKHE